MSLFNGLETDVLNALLGSGASLIGGTVEIGLSTSTPNDDGTGITEPSGFGYARVSKTNNDANFPVSVANEKSNGTAIAFPQASGGSWGSITHWVLWEQGGPAKIWGMLDDGAGTPTPRTVDDGDDFSFPIGQLRITMD
jgi:hypothetical protein